MPRLGYVCLDTSLGFQNLRTWTIRRFRKHLVFYIPTEVGIEVVRVLHGARNIQRILKEET